LRRLLFRRLLSTILNSNNLSSFFNLLRLRLLLNLFILFRVLFLKGDT